MVCPQGEKLGFFCRGAGGGDADGTLGSGDLYGGETYGAAGSRDEDEIYGCLPLSRAPLGGRLLFRAQYLHDLGGEPYGLAAGLYL